MGGEKCILHGIVLPLASRVYEFAPWMQFSIFQRQSRGNMLNTAQRLQISQRSMVANATADLYQYVP